MSGRLQEGGGISGKAEGGEGGSQRNSILSRGKCSRKGSETRSPLQSFYSELHGKSLVVQAVREPDREVIAKLQGGLEGGSSQDGN